MVISKICSQLYEIASKKVSLCSDNADIWLLLLRWMDWYISLNGSVIVSNLVFIGGKCYLWFIVESEVLFGKFFIYLGYHYIHDHYEMAENDGGLIRICEHGWDDKVAYYSYDID